MDDITIDRGVATELACAPGQPVTPSPPRSRHLLSHLIESGSSSNSHDELLSMHGASGAMQVAVERSGGRHLSQSQPSPHPHSPAAQELQLQLQQLQAVLARLQAVIANAPPSLKSVYAVPNAASPAAILAVQDALNNPKPSTNATQAFAEEGSGAQAAGGLATAVQSVHALAPPLSAPSGMGGPDSLAGLLAAPAAAPEQPAGRRRRRLSQEQPHLHGASNEMHPAAQRSGSRHLSQVQASPHAQGPPTAQELQQLQAVLAKLQAVIADVPPSAKGVYAVPTAASPAASLAVEDALNNPKTSNATQAFAEEGSGAQAAGGLATAVQSAHALAPPMGAPSGMGGPDSLAGAQAAPATAPLALAGAPEQPAGRRRRRLSQEQQLLHGEPSEVYPAAQRSGGRHLSQSQPTVQPSPHAQGPPAAQELQQLQAVLARLQAVIADAPPSARDVYAVPTAASPAASLAVEDALEHPKPSTNVTQAFAGEGSGAQAAGGLTTAAQSAHALAPPLSAPSGMGGPDFLAGVQAAPAVAPLALAAAPEQPAGRRRRHLSQVQLPLASPAQAPTTQDPAQLLQQLQDALDPLAANAVPTWDGHATSLAGGPVASLAAKAVSRARRVPPAAQGFPTEADTPEYPSSQGFIIMAMGTLTPAAQAAAAAGNASGGVTVAAFPGGSAAAPLGAPASTATGVQARGQALRGQALATLAAVLARLQAAVAAQPPAARAVYAVPLAGGPAADVALAEALAEASQRFANGSSSAATGAPGSRAGMPLAAPAPGAPPGPGSSAWPDQAPWAAPPVPVAAPPMLGRRRRRLAQAEAEAAYLGSNAHRDGFLQQVRSAVAELEAVLLRHSGHGAAGVDPNAVRQVQLDTATGMQMPNAPHSTTRSTLLFQGQPQSMAQGAPQSLLR